jgi:DNA-directed RNA polymerase subunit RPC12/RpoP
LTANQGRENRHMDTPRPATLNVTCAKCGAEYELPASMAGRRGPCAQCGAEIVVPAPHRAASNPAARSKRPAKAAPQYIPVECRVCQTLMYGTPDQIGRPFKCPDCGAETRLPPPPPPQMKKMPAAMEGEQYEVWGVDEQPLPDEILASQPTYIPVPCTVCETLLHATLDQVGRTIACPDCGTRHVVPPPPPSVLVSDGADLQLDLSQAPAERPYFPQPVRRMLYEEEEEERKRRAAAKGSQGRRRMQWLRPPPE